VSVSISVLLTVMTASKEKLIKFLGDAVSERLWPDYRKAKRSAEETWSVGRPVV